uniref:histone-lysine N-methyltransferase SETMAR-like n=1 Tax=Bombus vancouverensis nearcticus TaxID=2705178 RepID=UPI00143A933D|nr:histone-lysine N-methyltransferase SETMAR-like [Bombus vancouverensis nearcticus]
MLYEFRKESSVTIARKNICAVYGENTLSSRTCRKWFQRFRAGNFCLEEEVRSGRPPQTDGDKIRDLVEKSPSLTVQEMSNVLKIPKTTIHRCLKEMGMVSKLNVWVPHELTERNRLERTTACMSLIARNKREPFLKRPCGDTINSDKYCAQLEKLREALAEKRPGLVNRNNVIFHHDNAKPHVAKSITKKLSEFN